MRLLATYHRRELGTSQVFSYSPAFSASTVFTELFFHVFHKLSHYLLVVFVVVFIFSKDILMMPSLYRRRY